MSLFLATSVEHCNEDSEESGGILAFKLLPPGSGPSIINMT